MLSDADMRAMLAVAATWRRRTAQRGARAQSIAIRY
jgi:hypothetical protein